MTRNDRENLERKLDHVIIVGNLLHEQYKHITCTERSSLLLALVSAIKQVSCNVANVRELLVTQIVDPFNVDYQEYARKYENLLNRLLGLAGAPMIDALDTSSLPIIGTEKIIEKENNRYHFNDVQGLGRLEYIRHYLIEFASHLHEDALDGLRLIIADLKGITEDYYRLNDHEDLLNEAFENLRIMYEKSIEGEEQDIYDELACNLDYYTQKHGWGVKQLKKFKDKYMQDCGELATAYFEGYSPAKELLHRRDYYEMRDVRDFFEEVKGYEILKDIVDKAQKTEGDKEIHTPKKGDRIFNIFGTYVENQNLYNKSSR